MSDENPCCGFKKKTVVMSFIGLCCLTLVVWTVMVTAAPPPGETVLTDNLTAGTNSSLVRVCPLDSSLSIENITLQLAKPANNLTKNIEKFKFGSSPTLCKCLCNTNMTLTDLQDAIRELKKELQREKANKIKSKDKNT